MGGVRQYEILLRKNSLLKSRRPCATCFELSLPVVLFLLLAYIRSAYEIKEFGPYFFQQQVLFPMSSIFFAEEAESQALIDIERSRARCTKDCNYRWNTSEAQMVGNGRKLGGGDEDGFDVESEAMNMVKDNLLTPMLCGGQVEHYLAKSGLVEKALFSKSSNNQTVKDYIASLDTAEAAEHIRKTIDHVRTYNFDEMQANLTRHRDEYLASDTKRTFEMTVDYLDAELRKLQAVIDKFDPSLNTSAPQNARDHVEGLIDDICSLKAWNQTKTSPMQISAAGWNLTVNASFVASSIVELRDALERGFKVDIANISAELRDFADKVENSTFANTTINQTKLDQELEELSTVLEKMKNTTAEWEGNATASWQRIMQDGEINATALSADLRQTLGMQIAASLERLPGANWSFDMVGFVEKVANSSKMFLSFLEGMSNMTNRTYNETDLNLSYILPWSLDELMAMEDQAKAALLDMNATMVSDIFDERAWWLSHFVKSRSMLARMLGEFASDWQMISENFVPRDLSFYAEERIDIMALYNKYRTEAGALLNVAIRNLQRTFKEPNFTMLEEFQNISAPGDKLNIQDIIDHLIGSNGTVNWTQWIEKKMPEYNSSKYSTSKYNSPKYNSSKYNLSGWNQLLNASQINSVVELLNKELNKTSHKIDEWTVESVKFLREVVDALNNISSKTAEQIEQDLIPQWESSWIAECPNRLNKTAIGEKVENTVRGHPAYYNQSLNYLREMKADLRVKLDEAHRMLGEYNLTELRQNAEQWRTQMLAFVDGAMDNSSNTTEAAKAILDRMQQAVLQMDMPEGSGGQCLKAEPKGCLAIMEEHACLASKDGTLRMSVDELKLYGEPCVWCGGGPCTSDSEAKCAPKDWLLSGEGRAYGSFIARTDYTVASQPCGLGGIVGGMAADALKAGLNITCPEPAPETLMMSKRSERSSDLSASSYIEEQIMNRKVLIAPYKGEVEKLFDLFLVDLAQGLLVPPKNTSMQGYQLMQAIMDFPIVGASVASSIKTMLQDRFIFMDSEVEVEDFARTYPDEVLLALVFRSADNATGNFPPGEVNVEYAIRLHAQLMPSTSRIMRVGRGAMFGSARITSYPYMDLYFSHLQEMFGRAAARLQVLRKLDEEQEDMPLMSRTTKVSRNIIANNRTEAARRLRVGLEQFPTDRYQVDGFIRVIQHTLPMFMILGWIYPVSLLVKEIVYEKQERLRDVMRIMGLKTWVYWASWFSSALVQLTALVATMTAIICGSKVLKHSDPLVVFIFFWLYSVVTVALSLLISSFFSRAKVAAACGGLGYYVLYMPYSLYNRFDNTLGTGGKNMLCLMSSTGFGIGMAIIAKWELVEIGLQWNNLFLAPPITYSGSTPTDSHSMGHVWMMFIVDTWLYLTLAWYVEKVCPGTLGLPQPWYFPVMPSYWFPKNQAAAIEDAKPGAAEKEQNPQLECWEAAVEGLETMVRIRELAKTFRNGKQALKGISLDMQDGTIVGLLGHNGAGKSTTMSILTGLYPPSKGDVTVNGVSVTKDSHGVRQQLGVCLQHNALYENITVEEHLRLFCCLKSVPRYQLKLEIDGLLHDVGLVAKRNAPTRALSGGMKRKLSICIALTGGSKVVTLDEPTAGVDATSRRDIWHLLAGRKGGRTTLLSTHFMDEADILSDRIAIIGEGRLTAIGSSLALKRKFADGYMLTVVFIDGSNSGKLTSVVSASVPGAQFVGGRGRELSYVLPFESRSSFAALFEQLQDDKVRKELGVDAYGLSAPTMEEVFLQASSMHEAGLHGRVRNGADTAPSPSSLDASTDDGTSSGISDAVPKSESGSSAGVYPVTVDEKPSAKDAAEVLEKPSTDSRPRSPQCMQSGTPRAEKDKSPNSIDSNTTVDTLSPKHSAHLDDHADHSVTPNSGARLWCQQFDALFRKRALSVRRDRKAWASQLLLPAMFVLIALVVARLMSVKEEEPPIKLSSDMFVGTIAAGSVTNKIDRNYIPMSGGDSSPFAAEVQTAFMKSAGESDEFMVYNNSDTSFPEYYMMNARSMQDTVGAVSMHSDEDGEATNVTLWFNNRAYHAIPVMTDLWNNARFHLLGFDEAKTTVWSHPLPKTQALLQEEMTGNQQVMTDLTVAITVILAMGFIPASFIVYLVHEKASSGKHQQLLSGITPAMYWINSFAWDMVNYFIPLMVCFIIFVAFQVGAYSGDNSFAVFILLLCYGAAMTPAMYCLEPLFKVPSTAYVTLIVCNIFTGTISTLAVTVMDLYRSEIPELGPINDFCKAVFPWLLPNYCLGRGLLDIAVNHYMNFAAQEFGICVFPGGACTRDPLTWEVAGRHVSCLAIMAPVWFGLRLMIEWGFCLRGLRKKAKSYLAAEKVVEDKGDKLVQEEKLRVQNALVAAKNSGGVAVDNLVITELAKSFAPNGMSCRRREPFHAVRGITVGVPAGECFGLLGVNGAGKTTTMRMITGDTDITRGDIFIGGWSVHNNRDKARQHLGYCPQFDALPDKLSVRETLALYARIRGVPSSGVKETVERMLSKMCLEAHQYNLCENLSGGNKRKLSTALALIGSPDVVLLDEPSTGVDVGARRFLWEVIGNIRKSGHAVVLTSHSMEECEVLCTRLTIMVHGQFRCLGSPTELKNVYGGGYTMAVKANLNRDQFCGNAAGADPCGEIQAFVSREVPCARLTEESVGLFRYKLGGRGPASQVPLAEIFQKLEQACAEGGALSGAISDYSLSQTSLEEVFLHFSQIGEREYAAEQGKAVELPTANVVLPQEDEDMEPPNPEATMPPTSVPTTMAHAVTITPRPEVVGL